MSVDLPGDPHGDQSPPMEWRAFELDGETVVAWSVPEGITDCFTVTGHTRNPRALVLADAVLYQGTLAVPLYDPPTHRVCLDHVWAGTIARLPVREWLAEPVPCLARLPPARQIP